MGVFIFFILVGLIAFSTYKSKTSTSNNVNISIWGTLDKTSFDSYINKYKQDSNLQFQLTYSYKSLDTIDSQLVEAIATGKAPDVILIPQNLIKRYLDKVYMITNIPQRTFQDTFVQESDLYTQPTGIFALPFFVDPLVMYWNKDMFSSALIVTPPTKWSEFPLLAEKLSKSDDNANIVKSAVSFGEFANVDNAKALLSALIMQAGSPIVLQTNGLFKSELNYQSTSDIEMPAVSALDFFTDYSNPKKTVYSWNRSLPSSKQSFLSEDLATYFGFASEYQDIKDKNPNLNFDVAMVPQVLDSSNKVTFGNIYGFAFLKSSQNIASAYSLISLLIGSASVSELLQTMYIAPARLDLISAGTVDPVKTVFYNSALISRGWIDPDSKQTDQLFQDMVENITTGKMSSAASVSRTSLELDNLLQ